MRYWFVAVFILGCAGGGTSAVPVAPTEAAAPRATPGTAAAADPEMVATIDEFLRSPDKSTAATILVRASNDDGVIVKMPGEIMSLLTGPDIDEDTSAMLLAGFIAGSVRPQYATGVKRDDFVASVRGVLTVYQRLGARSPQLDEAAARDRDGTLDAWARDWLAAHPGESGE